MDRWGVIEQVMNESFSWRILRVGALRDCLDSWQKSPVYAALDDGFKTASEIILDELGSNFLRHSGAKAKEMLVSITFENDVLELRFDDDGAPFDPTLVPDPPMGNIALLPVGGRGIFMARRSVDTWEYEYQEDRKRNVNVLRRRVKTPEEEAALSETAGEHDAESTSNTHSQKAQNELPAES